MQIKRAMSEKAAEAQAAAFDALDDWHGKCPKCKAELRGTIKQLKEHVCASGS